MEPIVSIVTVTFNVVGIIRDTIDSVLNQQFDNFEYIIIDGGSTDGTMDIINAYSSSFSYVISEPDKGIYDAMNKGVMFAKGDWIIFMNAGDSFVNNKVLSTLFLDDNINNNVDVIYGDTIVKYPWGTSLLKGRFFTNNDINLPFCHQSTLVRTSLMKHTPFDLSYKVASDYNFFYTLYKKGHVFLYCNLSIALYDAIGFSTERVLETYIEVSRTIGNNHGLNYLLKLCYFRLRTFMIRLIPQFVLDKYRKHRYTSS